jgi:tetratricopeptide (TPR) repeat protein
MTENHGLTHLEARLLPMTADDEPVQMTGSGTLARLRQHLPADHPQARVVHAHLERLLQSPHFDGSARSREFLRFVVDEVLAGRAAYLKQATIAVEVFGRSPDFDAVIDPIVRVQAGRLRRSLERYYLLSGEQDGIRIELPKGSYAPSFVESADAPAVRVPAIEPMQNWPMVAAFPLEAGGARDGLAAAKFMEELTAELGRYGLVRVIRIRESAGGRQPLHCAARFELSGMVLEGPAPIFAMRLEDRVTGQQIWADEFLPASHAGAAADVSDLGRMAAARIGSEHGVIARLLAGEHAVRAFPAADAYTPIARCQHFLFSRQVQALAPAVHALQEMTSRAPEIELAWTSLARLYLMNHSFELTSLFTPVEMAIRCANQSVLLEPASARTRCLMAHALLIKGELGAARRELQLALRLNGESLAYREVIGWLTALVGDWEPGVALMRSALERNPYGHPWVNHGLWADAMRRGDFESAYAAALDCRESNFFWRDLMSAAALGQLQRVDDARGSAAELLRAKPQFAHRGRQLIAHYIKDDALRAIIVDGLRYAGVEIL